MKLITAKLKTFTVALGLALCSMGAAAAPAFVIETTIVGTLQDTNLFGGCMARLSTDVEAQGITCGSDPLVSFDCLGKVGSKSAGNTNFSGAQLAYVTGNKVNIYVDDTKKALLDGFCYSSRIDLLAPAS